LERLAALLATLPDLSEVTGDTGEALRPAEARAAAVWAGVLSLPVSSFSGSSNFFDFGGSLQFFKLAKARRFVACSV